MSELTGQKIRQALLSVIQEYGKGSSANFQSGLLLAETAKRLGIRNNEEDEQALLSFWHELFRTGHLAWGLNLMNPSPPFCHVTERGRRALENISRDPANPYGYISHLLAEHPLNAVAESYIREALVTYNGNCYKATAVMVGCAAESLTLDLRDALVAKMSDASKSIPPNLNDWRIRTVLHALKEDMDSHKSSMPHKLKEKYDEYWPAIVGQVRRIRHVQRRDR